ncbi:MAG: hypothetical protein HFH85_04140 [Lachnospiraceae bacterium]|jgi:hypothetical protein|nr:hypothetical protein [Lachnospiraceae bacterium]
MAVRSILKNAAQTAGGHIEKAVIEIIDMRGRDVSIDPPVSVGGSSVPGLSAASTFGGMAAVADAAASVLQSGARAGILPYLSGATRKCFHVQFNPSELSLSGYGGGRVAKTDFSGKGGGISYEAAEVRIVLNVKLIFDKVDPRDAFLSDKLSSSVTAMAQGAVRTTREALGKKDNSVQTQVEGFIAALRSKYTNRITFHWGDMNYPGVLNRVSSQYTMFNVKGQPIRAVVNLSLVCADAEVSPFSMGIWQKHYEEAFQGGSQSYVKAAQKVGNLLNFNL